MTLPRRTHGRQLGDQPRPKRLAPETVQEEETATKFPTLGPHHIRYVKVGQGVPNLTTLSGELQDMIDVLLSRVDPPISGKRVDSMMEIASTFYARAQEINILLCEGERMGTILKGGGHYKFRTMELRSFLELAKNSFEAGSRRITVAKMDQEEDSY